MKGHGFTVLKEVKRGPICIQLQYVRENLPKCVPLGLHIEHVNKLLAVFQISPKKRFWWSGFVLLWQAHGSIITLYSSLEDAMGQELFFLTVVIQSQEASLVDNHIKDSVQA
ncbi:hypothetical protein ACJX0J_038924, partial [Zea mays]